MPSPEQKSDFLPKTFLEAGIPAKVTDGKHTALIHKTESGGFFIKVSEGQTPLFSASVSQEGEVSLKVPGKKPEQEALPGVLREEGQEVKPSEVQAQQVEKGRQEEELKHAAPQEKEKPVRLRGRIGTQVFYQEGQNGKKIASFSFGEHPGRAAWSYSNTLPQRPEKDTVWWSVCAFECFF